MKPMKSYVLHLLNVQFARQIEKIKTDHGSQSSLALMKTYKS